MMLDQYEDPTGMEWKSNTAAFHQSSASAESTAAIAPAAANFSDSETDYDYSTPPSASFRVRGLAANSSYSKTPLFGIPHNRDRGGSLLFTSTHQQRQQQQAQQQQKSLAHLKQYILESPFPQQARNNSGGLPPFNNNLNYWGNSSTTSSACSSLSSSLEEQLDCVMKSPPRFGNGTPSVFDSKPYLPPTVIPQSTLAEEETDEFEQPSPREPPKEILPHNPKDEYCSSGGDLGPSPLSLLPGSPISSGQSLLPSEHPQGSCPPTGAAGNSTSQQQPTTEQTEPEIQANPCSNASSGNVKKRGGPKSSSGRFKSGPKIIPFEDVIQEVDEESEAEAEAEYFSDSNSLAQEGSITLTRRNSTGDIISALSSATAKSHHQFTNQNPRLLLGTTPSFRRHNSSFGSSSPSSVLSKLPKRKLSHHKSLEMVLLLPTIPEHQSSSSSVV